jgi:hypothetical protein
MVSMDDSPSLGTSLTLASYTCFSSTLKSLGCDMISGVDIQRKGMEKEDLQKDAGQGDQQHYNFPDHFTFPEFLDPMVQSLARTVYSGQGRDKSFAAISYGNAYRWRAPTCWQASVKPQYLIPVQQTGFSGPPGLRNKGSRTVWLARLAKDQARFKPLTCYL